MSSAYGNDRTYLLVEPTFKKLSNGRLKCVETGHEIAARDKESYSKGKRCRLELINSAVAKRKPPFNMFSQDPDSRSNLICKLTGDSISKSEEQIWKHMNGRRFLDKLEEQGIAKRRANDRVEDGPARNNLKKKNNKGTGKEKMIDDSDTDAIETSKKKRKSVMDFWFPSKGKHWGFDDGRDRSVTTSEPGSQSKEEEEEVEEGSDNDNWRSEEIPTNKKRKFIADKSSSRKKKNDSARESQEEDRDRKSKGFTFPGHAWTDSCDAPQGHEEPLELPKLPFLIPADSEDNKDMNHGIHDEDMMNHEIPIPSSPSSNVPVEVLSGSFTSQAVNRGITLILKENFMGPYETWKSIPVDIHKLYWRKFQEKFFVKEEKYHEIKRVWEVTIQKRYISLLRGARREVLSKTGIKNICETKGKGPAWMKPAIWNAIVDKWDTPEWKEKSQCNRKNRMTEKDGCITKHAGGSISSVEHKLRLAKELGREPTQAELFQRLHIGKDKEFVDNKSKRVMEAYQAALIEKYGPERAMEVNFDEEEWTKVVGVPKKGGRLYGIPHIDLHEKRASHSRSEGASRPNEVKISSEQIEQVLKTNEELWSKIEEQKTEMEQQKLLMEQQKLQMEEMMEQQQSQIETMQQKMVALMAQLDGHRPR